MDFSSSTSPEPQQSKISTSKRSHSSNAPPPATYVYNGGDPFVRPSGTSRQNHSNSPRPRFQSSTSTHTSVLDPPCSSPDPQQSSNFQKPTPSHPPHRSLAHVSRPRNTHVSPDTTHTTPNSTARNEYTERRQPSRRSAPIAHPQDTPSRRLVSSSECASRRQPSHQLRSSHAPVAKPIVPDMDTIISAGDDEAAKPPVSSKLPHPSPLPTRKPSPDVVDLDGDEPSSPHPPKQPTPLSPQSKRPRTNSQYPPHAYENERNCRNPSRRCGKNRMPRKPLSVVITGSSPEPVKLPRLKSHGLQGRPVRQVTDGGKVIGGGNTPTRIDEQETVVVDDVECSGTKSVVNKSSLADLFNHQVQFDRKRANEVMAKYQRERCSLLILSFLGMNDVELNDLLRSHQQPQDDVERSLVLRNNQLTKFTQFLLNTIEMWNIRSLDLSHNSLSIACEFSRRLRILNLSWNQLSCFPTGIETLTELELLDLSHNRIRKAPPRLSQLKKLEILDLTGNNLDVLPDDCFGKDSRLEGLLIGCNFALDSLPACATYLTNIKVFQFEKTAIQCSLPKADLRLDAAELVNLLAGKDARALAKRKAAGTRESRSRRDNAWEVKIVT